ncbi:MAG: hypothetical protein AAF602_19310 [Myxococcota bacterium]
MSRPFDPPASLPAELARERTTARRWALVVGAWGLATTVVGTAVGATLQVLGAPDAAARLGLTGLVAGLGLGSVALFLERTQASRRPELLDGRGLGDRPLHGAVLGLPIVIALPALLWLVVVASVALESAIPAVLFGAGALGLAIAGFRVLAHHRLARALEAMEGRREPGSTSTLELLAESPLSPRQVRRTAKLSIAMTRLQEGRGLDALGWFEDLDDGEIGAWAATGRAMASLLLGQDPSDAEVHLAAAFESPWANEVRAQADAVRILVVWRRDGARAARALAESLRSAGSTPLHLALLVRLRAIAEDTSGAAALESDGVRALISSGLGRAIPELTPSPLANPVR